MGNSHFGNSRFATAKIMYFSVIQTTDLLLLLSMFFRRQADKSLEGRIQFEEIPSGNRFLTCILEAMRRNCVQVQALLGHA